MNNKTLYQKLWDSHVVKYYSADSALIYIDRHLVQEVSSPVAFSSLRERNLAVRHPRKALSMIDHVVPTDKPSSIEDQHAVIQINALEQNVAAAGIPYFSLQDSRQGIAHVVGPESGFTLPGTTLVCGDSHTATHGAFGSLAFGIGSSECEKILATQCLTQTRAKTMRINFTGTLPEYATSKDIALAVINTIGTSGGIGYAIEYAGEAIDSLSMEARMTLCNMTIEAGARIGLIAPDQSTYGYIKGRTYAPEDEAWQQAVAYWKTLPTDDGATFDKEIDIDITQLAPLVSWGTTPEQVVPIDAMVPDPDNINDQATKQSWQKALRYMQLSPGAAIQGTPIDRVFIGSCTNSRIEDLRAAANVVDGKQVSNNVTAIVVPGSGMVKLQAEKEGLDKTFIAAGFEWRNPGCSMCVAMNNDRLEPGERCASTSNRNFEGRQGKGGLTHLMSPVMAAAAALAGELTDYRLLD